MAMDMPAHLVEPTFTLRAGDPLAPFLVSIWSSLRYGDLPTATMKFNALIRSPGAGALMFAPDVEPAADAVDVVMAMFAWRGEALVEEERVAAGAAVDPAAEPSTDETGGAQQCPT